MYSFYNSNERRIVTKNSQNEGHEIKTTASTNFDTLQQARQDLIGEIQAVIEYDAHLHSTTDRLARETWENIKNEELMHVGELLGLLNYLDANQSKFVEDGLKEFRERMERM